MADRSRVSLTFDVDTISLWMSRQDRTAFSRGEFGVVGARRILKLLGSRSIHATFFVPGLTASTYPDLLEEIVDGGHEVGHHGNHHENPARLERDDERRVLEEGLAILENLTGQRPVGWRSPGGYVTSSTFELLIDAGFSYDSSLMGHDVRPSRCRLDDRWVKGEGVEWGTEVDLVEFPWAWHLDDFPWFEYIPPQGGNLTPPSAVLETWLGDLDWALTHEPGGVLTYTMHPQVIGRGNRMLMLEQLLDEIEERDVGFTTLEKAAADWRAAHPFKHP